MAGKTKAEKGSGKKAKSVAKPGAKKAGGGKKASAKKPAKAASKMMHAVALSHSAGAVNLELERFGSARKGITAEVEGQEVAWLTNDRSALIPVPRGQNFADVAVSGTPGRDWGVRVSKPPEVSAGMNGVLPAENQQPVQGVIVIDVP